MNIVKNNYLLTTGDLFAINTGLSQFITVAITSDGGGSTLVYEQSNDGVTWTTANPGYDITDGSYKSIGTSTNKRGRFIFPTPQIYFRTRCSTFVSGIIIGEAETSRTDLSKILQTPSPGAVTVVSPAITEVTYATKKVAGTGKIGATVDVAVDGVSVATTIVDDSGNWSATLPTLAAGTHTVTAKQGVVTYSSPTPTWSFTTTAPLQVPVNTALPTLSGLAQVGATLILSNGSWSNSPTSYTYSWYAGGVQIAGATSSTYVLTSSENGKKVTGRVVAVNAAGNSVYAETAATATITTPASTTPAWVPTVGGKLPTMAYNKVTDKIWTPTGGEVTRQTSFLANADANGDMDFANKTWLSDGPGTLFYQVDRSDPAAAGKYALFGCYKDWSGNGRILRLEGDQYNQIDIHNASGGWTEDVNIVYAPSGLPAKVYVAAVAFNTNDFELVVDGMTRGTDTANTPMSSRSAATWSVTSFGTQVVAYFNSRLSASEMATLTNSVWQSSSTGGSVPANPVGSNLIWADEFDAPLDMTTSTHVGDWRPNDTWQNINRGYIDFAGTNWNINPNEPGFESYSPFSVAGSVLTITSKRIPAGLQSLINSSASAQGQNGTPSWMGGMLITNPAKRKFKYGYFEVRARWPNPGKGMFPAIWLYSADLSNDPEGKSSAEIDILEIFGFASGNPWSFTLPNTAGTLTHQATDTTNWHIYGLDWQPTYIRVYKDNVLIWEVTGPNATWYSANMDLRLNFAMDAPWMAGAQRSDVSTPDPMNMEVDYVRVYTIKP